MTDYEAATAFLGDWGRFQQQVFFLLCLSIIPNGFTGLSVVFLADTPAHRCLVPAHANLSAAWRNSSSPPEEPGSRGGASAPSRCARYRLRELQSFSDRGLLPGVDVNLSSVPTEGCLDGWEYDRSVYTSTIVSEVCAAKLHLNARLEEVLLKKIYIYIKIIKHTMDCDWSLKRRCFIIKLVK